MVCDPAQVLHLFQPILITMYSLSTFDEKFAIFPEIEVALCLYETGYITVTHTDLGMHPVLGKLQFIDQQ